MKIIENIKIMNEIAKILEMDVCCLYKGKTFSCVPPSLHVKSISLFIKSVSDSEKSRSSS